MKIKDIIRLPEGRRLEFKKSMPIVADLAKTVVAFANDDGGDLYIGIQDHPRIISGIPETELLKLEEKIASIIHDQCSPVIVPEITFHEDDGNTFIKVQIHRGSDFPYHIKTKGITKGTYIRIGSTNRLADESIIAELHRKKRNASFDSEPVFGKSLDKLSIDDFKNQFHELTGEMLDDAAIKKLGLIKEQQSVLLPTNANELKAYPEIEFKWFEKGSQLQLQFIKKNYQPEIDHLIDLETIGMELAAMLDLSWDQVRTKSEPSWHQLVNLLAFAESARPIKELMSLMVWKNRSKFRAKYVTPLIELDLLRMTIPDKPNSSKQQYHLTKKGRKILELLRY